MVMFVCVESWTVRVGSKITIPVSCPFGLFSKCSRRPVRRAAYTATWDDATVFFTQRGSGWEKFGWGKDMHTDVLHIRKRESQIVKA